MKTTSNTILITGGGSGIGRGLADAFHRLGNRVIIGGRRETVLKEACEANPGMEYFVLDVADPRSIKAAAALVSSRFPDINCLINNAGIQRPHDLTKPLNEEWLDAEIDTNLKGLIRMCSAFVPLLRGKPEAAIINISSGIGFVPIAPVPIYCATKAAVHYFTLSLRRQLRETGIKVVELIPPFVATNLQEKRHMPDGPSPMPLDQFIAEAMEVLASDGDELPVGLAANLRNAAGDGVRKQFDRMNG